MKLLYGKVISGCVIFLVTLIGGMAPFTLLRGITNTRQRGSTSSQLNSLQAFACGVFVATCLLHLLPEARESIGKSLKSDLPVSEMIVSFGFLLLLVVENLILACHEMAVRGPETVRRGHRHGDTESVVVYTKQPTVSHRDPEERNSLGAENSASRRYGTVGDHSDSRSGQNGYVPKREADDKPPTPEMSDDTDDENDPLLKSDEEEVMITPVNLTEDDFERTRARSPGRKSTQSKTKVKGEKEDSSDNSRAVLKSFVLLLALSLHTVFDGLVVGLQKDLSEMWTLLAAIALHKGLVSVSIALSLLESHHQHPRASLTYLFLFSLVAPIGLAIGVVLTETDFDTHAQKLSSGILQSVATGTFMYVTFVESLEGRFDSGNRLLNILLLLVGFACVCGLKVALPS